MPESDFQDLQPDFNVGDVVSSLQKGNRILKERLGIQRQLLLSAQFRDADRILSPEAISSLARLEEVLTAQSALQDALLAAMAQLLCAMAQELGLRAIGDAGDRGFTREAFAEARRLHAEADAGLDALEESFPGLKRALYAQDLAEMSLNFVSDMQFDPSEIQVVLAEAWETLPEESDAMIEGDSPGPELVFRVH